MKLRIVKPDAATVSTCCKDENVYLLSDTIPISDDEWDEISDGYQAECIIGIRSCDDVLFSQYLRELIALKEAGE